MPTTSDGIHSDETCFMSGENMEVPSMFPDVANFPSEPDVYEATSPCVWRGQACESYTLKAPTYDENTGSNQKPGASKLEELKTSRSFSV